MQAEQAISYSRSPRQRYLAAVERGELLPDPAQAELVNRTQTLYEELTRDPAKPKSILDGLRGIVRERNRAPIRGLYIWGGVGRGKTLLMNYFHDALPFEGKLRIHFHAFMQYIHGELKALGQRESPLTLVADGLARDTRVICFDEFHVSDIATLCETPRSAADYIEIARRFHTVLIAQVPRLDDDRRDSALRFIHLIDALYERSVNLVISADAPPGALYTGYRLGEKFARAASRLEEMQTRDYLAREHGP